MTMMIVLKIVMMIVLTIMMTVLTSTSHTSHNQLIVVLMERSKQNKHVVCNKDNDVEDSADTGVDNGNNDVVEDCVDNGVDDGEDRADKHLTHLSQVADCCLIERSKQNKHAVCNKDNCVDNGVDSGDNDSVEDDGDDMADKYLTHLSQAADCCLTERSKQNKHVVCDKDDDVDN
eukprot:10283841-Ditylum_brightwellii.AAC.1